MLKLLIEKNDVCTTLKPSDEVDDLSNAIGLMRFLETITVRGIGFGVFREWSHRGPGLSGIRLLKDRFCTRT